MVTEALRNYLSLAGGLVDVSRQQALRAARALASPGEVNQDQIAHLAEELLAVSRRNRDALLHVVGHEIERARERLGVAPAERVEELADRVASLEAQVGELRRRLGANEGEQPTAPGTAAAKATAARTTASKAGRTKAATKAGATKATGTKGPRTGGARGRQSGGTQ